MENFWLIDGNSVIDTCIASSVKEAQKIFDNRAWVIGEVISEADAIIEASQNALESQSSEC